MSKVKSTNVVIDLNILFNDVGEYKENSDDSGEEPN